MPEDCPEERTGVQKILIAAKSMPWAPDKWRMSVSLCLIVLMGDHLGSWDIDGIFEGGEITPKEIIAMVAAVGVVYNSLFKH